MISTESLGTEVWLPADVPIVDFGNWVGTRHKGEVTALVRETLQTQDTVKEFENRYNQNEDLNPLPVKRFKYWTEYRIPQRLRIVDLQPGPERLVAGSNGELFYTGDHYGSFTQLEYRTKYKKTMPDGFVSKTSQKTPGSSGLLWNL